MEAVLSCFVLTVGIVTMLILVSKNLQISQNSRDSIIASNLAQEGVELVRNARDNNLADGHDAFCDGTAPPCARPFHADLTHSHVIDAVNNNANLVDGFPVVGGFPVRLFFKNNFYTHDDSGSATKFWRKIIQSHYPNEANSTGRKVISVVTWTGSSTLIGTILVGNYANTCTTANKCVYVEDFLSED